MEFCNDLLMIFSKIFLDFFLDFFYLFIFLILSLIFFDFLIFFGLLELLWIIFKVIIGYFKNTEVTTEHQKRLKYFLDLTNQSNRKMHM